MENFSIFAVTVIFYFLVVVIFKGFPETLRSYVKNAVIIALLCLPININGNVYTLIGNAKGEENVTSVFSVYQDAEKHASTLILIGYQHSGENARAGFFVGKQSAEKKAFSVFFAGSQHAKEKAGAFVGVFLTQKSDTDDALLLLGISAKQEAEGLSLTGIGIVGYQTASEQAGLVAGISGYQKAWGVFTGMGVSGYQNGEHEASTGFGIFGYQRAENVLFGMGLSGYQKAGREAENWFAITGLQKAGKKERVFAVWSTLTAE